MNEVNQLSILKARAPAKIIFSGEHAVVYGNPALAYAVDRFVTINLSESNSNECSFNLINFNLTNTFVIDDLKKLRDEIDQRYQEFLQGNRTIELVIKQPSELLEYTLAAYLNQFRLVMTRGVNFYLHVDVPLGCGMGSSASAIISLLHLISHYFQQPLLFEEYFNLGRRVENLQHGSSSGVDILLSTNGGGVLFANGVAQTRPIPAISFNLVNTGKPQTATGICVKHAAKYFNDSQLLAEFAAVTNAIDLALPQNNIQEVQRAVKENHRLLQRIGVVPVKVSNFIEEVELRGGAAKISGAGAVAGEQAGIVLVIGDTEIGDLINKYGFELITVHGEPLGVRML